MYNVSLNTQVCVHKLGKRRLMSRHSANDVRSISLVTANLKHGYQIEKKPILSIWNCDAGRVSIQVTVNCEQFCAWALAVKRWKPAKYTLVSKTTLKNANIQFKTQNIYYSRFEMNDILHTFFSICSLHMYTRAG